MRLVLNIIIIRNRVLCMNMLGGGGMVWMHVWSTILVPRPLPVFQCDIKLKTGSGLEIRLADHCTSYWLSKSRGHNYYIKWMCIEN